MIEHQIFTDPIYQSFAQAACWEHVITLHQDKTRKMGSWIAGLDIYIGDYGGDEELMAVSFAHELGHQLVSWEFKERSGFNTLMIELEAWHLGVRYAVERHGLIFSDRALAWGYGQALTYVGHDERERHGWVFQKVVPYPRPQRRASKGELVDV